ncbi:aspartic peptidase domain-containing protein [Ilyonectria destructans]|nr:aspartic peptidase domain-containing protein [Ilyonectria destructans]
MKLSLLALTAAQFGSCVNASPSCHDKRSVEEVGEGYWEEDAPPSLYARANPKGKKFKLEQIQNNEYHGLGVPMEMARAFGKYHRTPPAAVQQAVEAMQAPTPKIKAANTSGKFGTAQSIPTKYYDSQYVVPVNLGTPPQSTLLNLDTGSADLWTFTGETPTAMAVGHILYRPRKSTTSKVVKGASWGLTYGDGSGASGNVYTDKVAIGDTFVNSQAVQSATKVSSSIADDTFSSGIMGMAFSSLNSVRPTQQKTYFENLQSSLAQPIFTANLQKGLPGTYNFGYIDKTEYTGSIYYNPINPNSPFWQITLTGYQVGGNPYQKFNWISIVDTGTTLLLAPTDIVNAYYAKVKGAKMDPFMGVMVFPCTAKLPDFYFGLGPYRGKIPGAYMSYGPVGGGSCYGGLQTSKGIGFAILGDILLKAQFVVFNIKAKTVGFANKKPVPLIPS